MVETTLLLSANIRAKLSTLCHAEAHRSIPFEISYFTLDEADGSGHRSLLPSPPPLPVSWRVFSCDHNSLSTYISDIPVYGCCVRYVLLGFRLGYHCSQITMSLTVVLSVDTYIKYGSPAGGGAPTSDLLSQLKLSSNISTSCPPQNADSRELTKHSGLTVL